MDLRRLLDEIRRKTGWRQDRIAQELGVTQPTISRWVRKGGIELENRDKLLNLARHFNILPMEPSLDTAHVPVVGYVGAGGSILFSEGQGPFGEAPMPPQGPSDRLVAVKVQGDSMAGQLEDGWLVYYQDRREPPAPDMMHRLCVVGLSDGRVLVKKLLPGRQDGLYVLYSTNAAPLMDQQVEWAAKVSWIYPS